MSYPLGPFDAVVMPFPVATAVKAALQQLFQLFQ